MEAHLARALTEMSENARQIIWLMCDGKQLKQTVEFVYRRDKHGNITPDQISENWAQQQANLAYAILAVAFDIPIETLKSRLNYYVGEIFREYVNGETGDFLKPPIADPPEEKPPIAHSPSSEALITESNADRNQEQRPISAAGVPVPTNASNINAGPSDQKPATEEIESPAAHSTNPSTQAAAIPEASAASASTVGQIPMSSASPQTEKSVHTPAVSATQAHPPTWLFYLLLGLVVALLGLVAFLFFNRFGNSNLGQIFFPSAQAITITPLNPTRPAVSLTPSTNPGSLSSMITATPSPSQSPTNMLVLSPTAGITLSPTVALSPTPKVKLLFEDHFVEQPNPQWQIQGDYYIKNQELVANGNLTLFLPGDWKDYQVKIAYGDWCDTGFCTVTIGLRAADPGNMMAIMGAAGKAGIASWSEFSQGNRKVLESSQFTIPDQTGTLTLQAQGDNYQVLGPIRQDQITRPGHPQGGLYLKVFKNFKLISVQISEIPK